MGIKFTEQELEEMLRKNKGLKVASVLGASMPKISIEKEVKKKKTEKISLLDNSDIKDKTKKTTQSDVKSVNELNKICQFSYSFDENHFSFVIFGARLLSVNQLFAILQYRKYEVFKYKKVWHEIVNKIIDQARLEAKQKNLKFPFFDEKVELTLFRQAPKLVDEDAMTTMYKFIIDAIKQDDKKKIIGLITEDNPKIVHKISCYSEKGDYAIGFKVEKIKDKKRDLSLKDLLIP